MIGEALRRPLQGLGVAPPPIGEALRRPLVGPQLVPPPIGVALVISTMAANRIAMSKMTIPNLMAMLVILLWIVKRNC